MEHIDLARDDQERRGQAIFEGSSEADSIKSYNITYRWPDGEKTVEIETDHFPTIGQLILEKTFPPPGCPTVITKIELIDPDKWVARPGKCAAESDPPFQEGDHVSHIADPEIRKVDHIYASGMVATSGPLNGRHLHHPDKLILKGRAKALVHDLS